MFATRTTRLRLTHNLSRLQHAPVKVSRRNISFIHELSEGFLDLAQALPLPLSLPPYSTTIILITFVTRLTVTVPFSIWAKRRTWRMEELAVPELKEAKPEVSKQVISQMSAEGLKGSQEFLRETFTKRATKAMTNKRNELFRKYKCTPFATMLIPPLSQLPLFALTSVTLSHACQAPTILDSESFLTITSLSHPDPTTALPIALGLISLANVESAKWWVSDVARERLEIERKKKEENEKKGVREIKPRELVQGALRALSVGRILLGALVPGGVLIYWVSSAAFGLFQTWAFDYWDYRRAQARRHLEVQATKTSTAKTLAQAPSPPLPPRSSSITTKPSTTKVWTVQPPRAKSSKGKRR